MADFIWVLKSAHTHTHTQTVCIHRSLLAVVARATARPELGEALVFDGLKTSKSSPHLIERRRGVSNQGQRGEQRHPGDERRHGGRGEGGREIKRESPGSVPNCSR